MGTWIVISCILASGAHHEPRGHYRDFQQCEMQVKRFETELAPERSKKATLCWCHQIPAPASKPKQKIIYSPDRKAPL